MNDYVKPGNVKITIREIFFADVRVTPESVDDDRKLYSYPVKSCGK